MLEYLTTNVRLIGDCLVWAGTLDKGRPVITWHRKARLARRLMLRLMGEKIDDKVVVGNPKVCEHPHVCMNREHLLIGKAKAVGPALKANGNYCTGVRRSIASMRGKENVTKIPFSEMPRVAEMRAEGMLWREISAHYGMKGAGAHKRYQTWLKATGQRWSA